MTREDWPALGAALKGIWAGRDLAAGAFYLRLLEPYSMTEINGAIDRLAATSRYAPRPAELLREITCPTRSAPELFGLDQAEQWVRSRLPQLDGDPFDAAVLEVFRLRFRGLDPAAYAARLQGVGEGASL